MTEHHDKFRPTNATAEGQLITFTSALGKSKAGRVVAWLMLLGGFLFVVVVAVSVLSA